ncbi:hypothetical protein D3C74_348050 [compost metagenome]
MNKNIDYLTRQLVVQIDFLKHIEQIVRNGSREKRLQQSCVRLIAQHHIILMNIAFISELSRYFKVIFHLHSKLFLMAVIHTLLLSSHGNDLCISDLSFFLSSLSLPKMKISLMLKLIYQKTAARIKHSILIQQPAQILNAEVIFSCYIIGYSYCLRIKPHFFNKGTVHGFPRKT